MKETRTRVGEAEINLSSKEVGGCIEKPREIGRFESADQQMEVASAGLLGGERQRPLVTACCLVHWSDCFVSPCGELRLEN